MAAAQPPAPYRPAPGSSGNGWLIAFTALAGGLAIVLGATSAASAFAPESAPGWIEQWAFFLPPPSLHLDEFESLLLVVLGVVALVAVVGRVRWVRVAGIALPAVTLVMLGGNFLYWEGSFHTFPWFFLTEPESTATWLLITAMLVSGLGWAIAASGSLSLTALSAAVACGVSAVTAGAIVTTQTVPALSADPFTTFAGGGGSTTFGTDQGVTGTYGDPYGSYGTSYGYSYGDSYGSSFGDSYGDSYGTSFGNSYGDSYGNSYGNSYGDSFGSSFGDTSGNTGGDASGVVSTAPDGSQLPLPVNVQRVGSTSVSRAVAASLSQYFGGINDHDWPAVAAVVAPRLHAPARALAKGDATSSNSRLSIVNISGSAAWPHVTVTIRSHQAPRLGPDHESCTDWLFHYVMQRNPTGDPPYLIYKNPARTWAC